ncbi:MAG TPA: FAD-dependent oxidoreductase [Solirubrobacteraceae bacterium]|nr:FAD-dependent oxidoreductase [Solirubrobacteraceae bacterium]
MRIAIVGAGISGLVAAHLLHGEHDVSVFEAADWIGGHTHTVRVQSAGEPFDVDTGFIVMNDRNYPNFERILAKLGVATQASNMSFSVSDGRDFEYSSTSLAGLFANPRHLTSPRFLRMLSEVRRFQREAGELLTAEGEGPSLRDYLEQRSYSREFVEHLIVPQATAVWSADPRQMWTFPARLLAQFFENHGMLALRDRPKWRTVTGGSHRYVERLTAPFSDRILLSRPVTAVTRVGSQVEVTARGLEAQPFDRVVIATHSDQALGMLTNPSDREHEILGAIPYQPNEVVLHTDRRLLPRRRRAWASWNYHLDPDAGASGVTYHMNRLQSMRAPEELCVTLNSSERIEPGRVLGRWNYAHPVYTAAGLSAQRRRGEIDGVDGIHYCGAYWGWGFHEDGVVSALQTCTPLGGRL